MYKDQGKYAQAESLLLRSVAVSEKALDRDAPEVGYALETLVGRQVAAVVNFAPRQIGKFVSEVLTLGMPDENGAVVLIAPDRPVPDGGRLF